MAERWEEIAGEFLGYPRPNEAGDVITVGKIAGYAHLKAACKRIAEMEARAEKAEAAIRRTWHALDEAPPPHFITQDLRLAVCEAAHLLSPKPWEAKRDA